MSGGPAREVEPIRTVMDPSRSVILFEVHTRELLAGVRFMPLPDPFDYWVDEAVRAATQANRLLDLLERANSPLGVS